MEHVDTKLKALDRLVGSWRATGGEEGTVTYRRLDGGYFLIWADRADRTARIPVVICC
jgi:hypothetical protein